MTLTLSLPDYVEERLNDAAARQGLTVQDYALRALLVEMERDAADHAAGDLPTTGAEALAYWKREGVLGLFEDRPDTPEFARDLRRQAERRGGQAPETDDPPNAA